MPRGQGFEKRLGYAVQFLRERKPGAVVAALNSVRGGDASNHREAESRWAGGVPDGARNSDTPQILALVASHLASFNKGQAAHFIEAYVAQISDRPRTWWETAASKLTTQNPRSSGDWVEFALYLHLLSLQGEYDTAHAAGTREWFKARQGYDVPAEVFAIVRFAIFRSKQRCLASERSHAITKGILEPLFIAEHISNQPYEMMTARDIPVFETPPEFAPLQDGYAGARTFLCSPQVDDLLQTDGLDDVLLVEQRQPYSLPPEWAEFAARMLKEKVCKPEVDIFDGAKVMPRTVPSVSQLRSGNLEVCKSSYLQSVSTGWAQHVAFQAASDIERRLSIGTDPDFLRKAANHIGIVSLAISRLGELIVMEQSSMNNQGAGKLVPFGGSAEYYDLPKVARDGEIRLTHFVRYSMMRELTEELDLERSLVKGVHVLGQTLDSSRGLHLDYHGVSFLDCSFDDIKLNREHLFGGVLFSEQLNTESPSAFLQSILAATSSLCSIPTNPPDDFLKASLAYLAQAHQVVLKRFHDAFRPSG